MSNNKIFERFCFRYEFGEFEDTDHLENTLDFCDQGITVDELLERFEQFLRGSGYRFTGHLEIVDDRTEVVMNKSDL